MMFNTNAGPRSAAMSKALAVLMIFAALGLLYAAAELWLAPRLVRDALLKQAREAGVELRTGELSTDLFALSASARDIQVSTSDGQPLASAQSVSIDFLWASLWRDRWIIETLTLQQPVLQIVVGPKGELNWPDGAAPAAEPRGQGGQGARFEMRSLSVAQGEVRIQDRSRAAPVGLALQNLALEVTGLSSAGGGDPAAYELAANIGAGGKLASQGSLALQPLGASGKLSVAAADLAELWRLAAPAAGAPGGQVYLSAQYSYAAADGRLVLENAKLEAARVAYALPEATLELPQVALESPRIALPLREPIEVSGEVNAIPGGRLSASGRLGPRLQSGDLEIALESLPLALAQPWLSAAAAARIASGMLRAEGRLTWDGGSPPRFQGGASVTDLRLESSGAGDLLLAWQAFETRDATVTFGAPFTVDLGEALARAPQARLVVLPDGKTNLSQLRKPEEERQGDPALAASIRRLRLEEGTLHFADRSLENAFEVTVRELAGSVHGFSTAQAEPARILLEGRVQKYGSAQIRGTVNLDEPASRSTVSAELRNLDLQAFTPYFVKFAGYRVQSGRLSAELRYRVREGRLVGENQLVIERLRLGEKVKDAGLLDLPLEMAVAVLTDAQGRIDLGIPVRGNLRDPKFDLGSLVGKAVGNMLGKIASAPFRALASLAGSKNNGETLQEVLFEPGSAALAPPEEEDVDRVAKALGERPQLALSVRGGYAPEADLAALRERALRRELAGQAGYRPRPGEDPPIVDLREPKVLRAAEALYLSRVGNRLELNSLRSSERYARALFDRLARTIRLDPERAQELARARAHAVRASLAARGVDPSRVRVAPPAKAPPEDRGIPTRLSLEIQPASG